MPSCRSSRASRLGCSAAAALLAALAAGGCGGGDGGGGEDGGGGREAAGGAAPQQQDAVVIREFKYEPATISVPVGTKVSWRNDDDARHTATATGPGAFDTGTIEGGATGSATLDTPGKIAYVCEFHAFMKGTIEVR
jgi:plastocyanin